MLTSEPIMAIGNWRNNAELLRSCAQLGYLRKEWRTLDPTYGLGRFWTLWRPDDLVACDLDPEKSPIGYSVDYRLLTAHFDKRSFDAVTFDPGYKLNGTSAHVSDKDYGVGGEYQSVEDRHQQIREGIAQCSAVLKPGGMMLIKCMDQINAGRARWQTREFADHAESLGCRLVDMLHIQSYRPQPSGRSQQHARRNYSTLLILKRERNS